MATSISAILVPRGAEHQTVCRGLQNLSESGRGATSVPVVPIPMGIAAVKAFQWQQHACLRSGATVLVMGLCGSLRTQYQAGDAVLYQACHTVDHQTINCDSRLTDWIAAQVSAELPRVQAFTSPRFISSAAEKHQLAVAHKTDVVDMEGAAILAALLPLKIRVAMLRVVSDGCEWDTPNLTTAIHVNGQLSPSRLLLEMAQQPKASLRFVRGSLQGLRRLRQITAALFDTAGSLT